MSEGVACPPVRLAAAGMLSGGLQRSRARQEREASLAELLAPACLAAAGGSGRGGGGGGGGGGGPELAAALMLGGRAPAGGGAAALEDAVAQQARLLWLRARRRRPAPCVSVVWPSLAPLGMMLRGSSPEPGSCGDVGAALNTGRAMRSLVRTWRCAPARRPLLLGFCTWPPARSASRCAGRIGRDRQTVALACFQAGLGFRAGAGPGRGAVPGGAAGRAAAAVPPGGRRRRRPGRPVPGGARSRPPPTPSRDSVRPCRRARRECAH